MDEPIRLYEFNYRKPELEDAVIHYGIKGMHWGIRKDRKPQGYQGSGRKSKKKTLESKIRKNNAKVGKNKSSQNQNDTRRVSKEDIHNLNKNKEKYSTNEINEILNRYNTEQRLSDLDSKLNPTNKTKAKKVVDTVKQHPYIVALPVVALLGLAHAAKTYKQGVIPDFPDTNSRYAKNFIEDYTNFYKKGFDKSNKAIRILRRL